MSGRRRELTAALLLVGVALLAMLVLRAILWTVFLAITVAYVLYPVRQWLRSIGAGRRTAAVLSTLFALTAAGLLFVPMAYVLYVRREDIATWVRGLPEAVPITFGEFEYPLEVQPAVVAAREWLMDVAIALTAEVPELALHGIVFVLVIYALLQRPSKVGNTLLGPVPAEYRDVVYAFHYRLRDVLYALYGIQAITAFATAVIAYPIFALLGYPFPTTLAVLAGILQFIPVLGPSVLVAGVAATDLVAGDTVAAMTILAVGLFCVGFLPDAVLRPRLAALTTGMPASLYFVGFTGGVLSVGAVGIIVGPVAIAMLSEAVRLVVADATSEQPALAETATPTGE